MMTDSANDEPALPEGLSFVLDERPGPAHRISSQRAAAMIHAALDARPVAELRDAPTRPWIPALAAAAALMLVVVGSVAAMRATQLLPWFSVGPAGGARWTKPVRSLEISGQEVISPMGLPLDETRELPREGTFEQAADRSLQPPAEEAREAAVSEASNERDHHDGARGRRSRRRPRRQEPGSADEEMSPQAESTLLAGAGSAEVEGPPRGSEAERVAPIDLLARANTLRTDRAWRDAEALYAQVATASPGTMSSYVARVAAAGLRLDHLSDPAGALTMYRAAMRERPNGVLDAEVRDGIARALRARGDRAGEIRALRDLEARHPDSSAALRAAERLRALGVD